MIPTNRPQHSSVIGQGCPWYNMNHKQHSGQSSSGSPEPTLDSHAGVGYEKSGAQPNSQEYGRLSLLQVYLRTPILLLFWRPSWTSLLNDSDCGEGDTCRWDDQFEMTSSINIFEKGKLYAQQYFWLIQLFQKEGIQRVSGQLQKIVRSPEDSLNSFDSLYLKEYLMWPLFMRESPCRRWYNNGFYHPREQEYPGLGSHELNNFKAPVWHTSCL